MPLDFNSRLSYNARIDGPIVQRSGRHPFKVKTRVRVPLG